MKSKEKNKMDREKQRVMEMLEQGRITPDEAARLLDCLESSAERESVRVQEDEREKTAGRCKWIYGKG